MAEVVRSIKWDEDGKPCLCVQPKINPERYDPFAVQLDSAWMYSRDHNPDGFVRVMQMAVGWMFNHWNLGLVERGKWSSIASFIEDGISDLLKAKPRPNPVDLAVRQMTEEAFKNAAKNAEIDGNRVKMTFEIPVGAVQ